MIKEGSKKGHPKQKITNWEMYLYSVFMGIAMKTFNVTGLVWGGMNISNWLIGIGVVAFTMDSMQKHKPYKKALEGCNLVVGGKMPNLIKKRYSDYGFDLVFSLPPGLSSKQFEQKKTELEDYLGGDIEISVRKRKLILQVYTEKSKSYYDYKYIEAKGMLEFAAGYTHGNKLVMIDFKKVIHILVAGETGSGKSTFLRSMITSFILSGKKIELHLIDLKNGAEFRVFEKCKQIKTFSKTVEDAEDVLLELVDEIDRRANLLYLTDTVDIQEYSRLRGVKKMPYKVIVVDEFADFQYEKTSLFAIQTIAAKARACGIHLILSTQRPDMNILRGAIKANIPCAVGFKTINATNSRIIIDKDGLEELRGKGHGILKFGEYTEFQSMFLNNATARDLIKHTYIKKSLPEKTEEEIIGLVQDFNFLKLLEGGKE